MPASRAVAVVVCVAFVSAAVLRRFILVHDVLIGTFSLRSSFLRYVGEATPWRSRRGRAATLLPERIGFRGAVSCLVITMSLAGSARRVC